MELMYSVAGPMGLAITSYKQRYYNKHMYTLIGTSYKILYVF